MLKIIKKEFRNALVQLLEYYRKHTDTIVINAQTRHSDWDCPLCSTVSLFRCKCTHCPWMVMTGQGCVENGYESMQVTDRIAQIEEWLKYVEPDFDDDMIICNLSRFCGESRACGGAIPHTKQGCDKCPIEDSAKCIPLAQFLSEAVTQRDWERRVQITQRTYDKFGNQP